MPPNFPIHSSLRLLCFIFYVPYILASSLLFHTLPYRIVRESEYLHCMSIINSCLMACISFNIFKEVNFSHVFHPSPDFLVADEMARMEEYHSRIASRYEQNLLR